MNSDKFDSDFFISYIRFRNILLVNKSEWVALFYHCYHSLRGGENSEFLNLLPEDEKKIQKNENFLCSLKDVQSFNVNLLSFVTYVEECNINLLPKSEWQQAFFFFFVREYKKSTICTLSTVDLYDLCDFFKLDYNDISLLIKKTNIFDNLENECDFSEFVNKYLDKTAFTIDSGHLSFEIVNPRVKERLQRLLRKNNIFQDSSFNKNIVKISDKDFAKLINAEDKKYQMHLTEKIKSYIKQHFTFNRNNSSSDFAKDIFEKIEMQYFSKAISIIFYKLTGSLDLLSFKEFISFFTHKQRHD